MLNIGTVSKNGQGNRSENMARRDSIEPSTMKEIELETDNAEQRADLSATVAERVPDSKKPSTTKEIQPETNNAGHSPDADLSPDTVAEKAPRLTSDNSRVGMPATTAAKKQPRKRKRTVVNDTDVEDSDDDLKPEQR